ncbi:MAG: hypothetical protein ACI32N_07620 [Bulleidia sp.]
MKKALIFDAYDQYTIRIRYIQTALENCGYETQIFFADFDHVRKQYYMNRRENVNYIHVTPYKRNLSIERLYSHAQFAKACVKEAEKMNDIDLIYVMVPPNSMAKEFGEYRQRHPEVRLWFDVLDMWPESLPVGHLIKSSGKPVFRQWSKRRDNYLKYADLVTPECRMFENELRKHHDYENMHTVYLCQKEQYLRSSIPIDEEIHFLYCGTINNIIDIQLIGEFLWQVKKNRRVFVDVIGDGEHRQDFLLKLNEINVPHEFHGYVYDEKTKEQIYRNAHFGLNCMKDSVFVGLTMKSLDYLSHGFPLVNNIKGDTTDFVNLHHIGMNISEGTLLKDAEKISGMTQMEYDQICENVISLFRKEMAEQVVISQLEELIRNL